MPIGTDILQWTLGDNITLDVYNPDPFGRAGQHKQGLELKNKSRKRPGWIDKSGKRRPKPPKKHTPGRDHKHHQNITIILDLLLNIIY